MQTASQASVETTSPERRRARRYQVDWAIRIFWTDSERGRFEEAGVLQNLSSRGAFGTFAKVPTVGSRIKVSIRLPNSLDVEKWMKYSAEVLRIESHQWGVCVAIRFVNARPRFSLRNAARGKRG